MNASYGIFMKYLLKKCFIYLLLDLLEISILDIVSLCASLLSLLLLTTIELVTARLAGCSTLLVHLL